MTTHGDSSRGKLGKCCFIEAGDRCGCQCYRENISDQHTCDVCFHDAGFHEKVDDEKPMPNSLLNQVLAGQALEEQSIANELSQTFSRRNLANPSVGARRNLYNFSNQGSSINFDPVSGATNYSLMQGRNRRRRQEEIIRETCIQVILLPDVGFTLKSPTAVQEK